MIYVKTLVGQTALHDRNPLMSPRQRAAFIMFDGKRDSVEVIKATSGVGVNNADIEHLASVGFLESTGFGTPLPAAAGQPEQTTAQTQSDALKSLADGRPSELAQANYATAYPIATRLTAGLGLRGFRLNLAVEAAGDLEKLKALAPRIKDAVGADRFKELEDALYSY